MSPRTASAAEPDEPTSGGSSFTIRELVERSGVPVATIHHYRRLRLLPPAQEVAPNRFLYDHRHLQALLLIRRLRERELSLDAIAEILPDLMASEEEAFRPDMWERAARELRSSGRGAAAGRLVAAATRAFARHGYAEVTVSDVSAAAGLGKGTVYRHFASKEELFFAVAGTVVADVVAAFDEQGGNGRMQREKAAAVLAVELRPHLPIVLDLVSGALRHQPGHEEAAQRFLLLLATHVGERVHGRGDPLERGFEVLVSAFENAVGAALGL
ncbi:MAG TPA: TetR family transcriptional regulator [Acidimicrobiales bacterium]|nr:TetR family transcriptional regulator [Acidimicrobiales bacterium]